MDTSISRHKLQRALSQATYGAAEDQRARHEELASVSAGIMQQQLQVAVSGLAWRKPHFEEFDVAWPYVFLMRTSPIEAGEGDNPHFVYGVELLSDEHIMIDCQVRSWNADDSDMIRGARIRFSVWAPEATKKFEYSAVVHMTFTGYATEPEDGSDDGEGDDDDDTQTLGS